MACMRVFASFPFLVAAWQLHARRTSIGRGRGCYVRDQMKRDSSTKVALKIEP